MCGSRRPTAAVPRISRRARSSQRRSATRHGPRTSIRRPLDTRAGSPLRATAAHVRAVRPTKTSTRSRPTGGGELRLTEEPNSDREPAWSPNGDRGSRSGATGRGARATPTASVSTSWTRLGGSETKIPATTADGVGTNATFPNWSPQGHSACRERRRQPPGDPCRRPRLRDDRPAAERLPERFGRRVNFPAWSPQGDKIAFMQRLPSAPTNDFDIVVMNTDGSSEVNLTRSAGTRDEDPDWQPAAAPVDATAPTVPSFTPAWCRVPEGHVVRGVVERDRRRRGPGRHQRGDVLRAVPKREPARTRCSGRMPGG